MSLKEQTIILTDKDSQGNTIMQFPITKAKNIEDVMSIAQGGTGANNIISAVKNLLQFYEEIPANADLNNYKTAGLYICASNITVGTLKNCPTDLAFVLRVEPLYCKQVITLYNRATFFSRYFQDEEPAGWQGWSQTATTEDSVTSKISVNAGTVAHDGTIPLPSGYSRSQCKYAVWCHDMPDSNASYGLATSGNSWHRVQVDQDTGWVYCMYQYDGSHKISGTAGYLCIAVK
jgi:hypothetical protein